MYSTGLNEQEKESLIKYICTKGEVKLKDGKKVFEFYNKEINLEEHFSPAYLLEKALTNIQKEVIK